MDLEIAQNRLSLFEMTGHFEEPESLPRAMCKFCRHHTTVHDRGGCTAPDEGHCRQPFGEPSLPIG
jgi:hypothetical protein